jgi:hypothetical protein
MMDDEGETTMKDGGKQSPGPSSTRRERRGVEFALTAEHTAATKVSKYQSLALTSMYPSSLLLLFVLMSLPLY